jgi:hypothetical protein
MFSLVSDFFGKKESVNANVGTTTAFDEQLAQSGTVVHSDTGKEMGGQNKCHSQMRMEQQIKNALRQLYEMKRWVSTSIHTSYLIQQDRTFVL